MQNQKKIDKYLDKLSRKSESEVTKIYATRYKEITKEIGKMFAKYESKGVLTMAEMSKYNRLEKSMDSIIRELTKAQDKAYLLAQKTMEEQFLENYFRSAYAYEYEAQEKMGFGTLSKEVIQEAVTNDIEKLTLSAVLERNRKEITDKIRQNVAQGLVRGSSYQEMTKIIRDSVNFDAVKARHVVATEAHRAQVLGRARSAMQAGKHVKIEKMWVSTLDEKTRSSHQDMDGVKVGIDEDFETSSGGRGKVPGSMNNAGDDIHCRCTVVYLVNGKEPGMRRARNEDGSNSVIPYTNYNDWYENRIQKK